jgi:hypothetical protein
MAEAEAGRGWRGVPPALIVAVGLLAAFFIWCSVTVAGDVGQKPTASYEACAKAARTLGLSEGDPEWLTTVGRCMDHLSTTTRRSTP